MKYLLLILSLFLLAPTYASTVDAYPFEDKGQEKIYKKLIQELRCMVCQNQNLADSNAELAQDMRRKTYDLAKSGKNEQEIVDYMVQRYGDFVLYKPPFQTNTMLLWLGPFVILVIGVVVLIRFIRRKPAIEDTTLSEQDRAKAEDLLNTKEGED